MLRVRKLTKILVRRANSLCFSFVDDVGEAIASGSENGLVTLVNYVL